jgi:hypothetical protein
MKKSEILTILLANNVSSSNLRSFISRQRKDLKKTLQSKEVKILDWLVSKELKKKQAFNREVIKIRAKRFNLSVVNYKKLQIKAMNILSMFSTTHSMGCYRTLFINGVAFASNDNLYTYSNSCTWSPTYGHLNIDMRKKELSEGVLKEGAFYFKGKQLTSNGNHKLTFKYT